VHTQIVRLPVSLAALYVPLKLVHDYLAVPGWKIIQRMRSRTHGMVARPDDGAR
jgi:hypothetical protein